MEAVEFAYQPQTAREPFDCHTQWIWLDREKFGRYQKSFYTLFCDRENYPYAVARFRKKIRLSGEVRKVTARVSADVKYRLWINGVKAGRGPAPAGGDYANQEPPEWWFYDEYDFTGLLRPGENIICAAVCLLPCVQADYSMGHGGFFFEAEVLFKNGERKIISSDESWCAELSRADLSPSCYDAEGDDGNWITRSYNDSHWPGCSTVESRWNLMPAELPPLMEAEIRPVRVLVPFKEFDSRFVNGDSLVTGRGSALLQPGTPVTFWLDFGKIYSGTVVLCAQANEGVRFTVEAQEIIGKSESKAPAETYIAGKDLLSCEGQELRSAQYLKVTVGNLSKPVEIKKISLNFICYPVSYRGSFSSSDGLLDQIYRAGRWSNQICMQQYHMDSPLHQEALGCTGDYMIQSLMNYYTFGDRWLTRKDILRTLYYLKQKQGFMFHTSYSLLWVQMLMDYYQYTGDASLLPEAAPVVSLLLGRFEGYLGRSGLLETPPSFMFIDWVQVGCCNLHHPPRLMGQGALTAFYCSALDQAARLFSLLGDCARSEQYRRQSEKTKCAFHRCLWDEKKQLYRDGIHGGAPLSVNRWMPPDCGAITFSQHTNALAVLYNIAPKEWQTQIMRSVFENDALIQAQPYFLHFVLEAAAHCGQFEAYGLAQIRRWKLLLDEKKDSLKEVWNGFDCDYSHAWGGTPTYQLPSKVLGIFPAEPAFRTVGIRPAPSGLDWVKGSVPTKFGTISAEYRKEGAAYRMTLSIPDGCGALVQFPYKAEGTVSVDGKEVRVCLLEPVRDCAPQNLVQIGLPSGGHTLRI